MRQKLNPRVRGDEMDALGDSLGRTRVGTCSWAEKSLIESGEFYPKGVTSAEEHLRFYASNFDTVEVDATYYAVPATKTVESWAARTPERFLFHVKAYGGLTGHSIDPQTLPKPIRELLPSADREERSIHLKDPSLLRAVADAFVDSLAPLRNAGKLGLIVFQYPPWFGFKLSNLDVVLAATALAGGLPIAVEFRHGSWLTPHHAAEVLGFLRQHRITYVTADEPQFGTLATVPFLPEATTDIAYFRLHGRNREAWLKRGGESFERYDYLYSAAELKEIAQKALSLQDRARTTFLMFNNCRAGHAMRNALDMLKILQG